MVLDRNAGKLALHKITSGSWGGALASANVTVNDSTAYTVKVVRLQQRVQASVVGQGGFDYGSSTDFGTGQSGFFSDKTGVTFDDLKAHDGTASNPLTPRIAGMVDASISAGTLLVTGTTRGSEAVVENFSDDDYMVQVDVDHNGGGTSDIWFRYHDASYRRGASG